MSLLRLGLLALRLPKFVEPDQPDEVEKMTRRRFIPSRGFADEIVGLAELNCRRISRVQH